MELGTNLTLACMVVIFQINRVIGRLHVAVKKKIHQTAKTSWKFLLHVLSMVTVRLI